MWIQCADSCCGKRLERVKQSRVRSPQTFTPAATRRGTKKHTTAQVTHTVPLLKLTLA